MPRRRLRIIGGARRGRVISFPAIPGLRPTPDAARETLFNWLQPMIEGARCLDLFAGSGALGLEAASRGAAAVVMVERNIKVARQLRQTITVAALQNAQVIKREARRYLAQTTGVFDIVFIDPPYGRGLAQECCALLESRSLVAAQTRVYVEAERALQAADLPANWRILHAKNAGQVFYHLAARAD